MSKQELHEYIDSALLTTGVSSWGLFEMAWSRNHCEYFYIPIRDVTSCHYRGRDIADGFHPFWPHGHVR